MITCPSCKSPVEVPAGYDAETIRCGICWAEIDVGIRELQPVEAAIGEEVILASPEADPFVGIPGRPALGMAPLEDLLRTVCARMPQLLQPVKVKRSKPMEVPPPVVKAPRPAEPRVEEEGLRRKRGGTLSS